jgi:hypothetical protein
MAMVNLLIAMSSGVVNFHEHAGHCNKQPAPGNEQVCGYFHCNEQVADCNEQVAPCNQKLADCNEQLSPCNEQVA